MTAPAPARILAALTAPRLCPWRKLPLCLGALLWALAALFVAPSAAYAQDKILFVSSDESGEPLWNKYIVNARTAFTAVAPAGTFVDRTGRCLAPHR